MIRKTELLRVGGRSFAACAVLCAFYTSVPVAAAESTEQSLIDGAKLCTQYLPRHERQYGIPEHLLAAIASTESGRFHRGLGLNLPWPWTINVAGRGYFFDTKAEAVAAVNKLRSEGAQSIDVGCMQVNLRHHPHAFASVEQAFDPAYNVGYAAQFLKRNFMEDGSWRKATGSYHSRNASYGSPYAQQVFSSWGRIVAKVADARAGRPMLNQAASNAAVKNSKPFNMASRVVRPYRSPHMYSMTVSSRDRRSSRENGVLVIRPQTQRAADSQPDIVQYGKGNDNNDGGLVIKAKDIKAGAIAQAEAPADRVAALPAPGKAGATKTSATNTTSVTKQNGVKVVSMASATAALADKNNTPARGQFTPKGRATPDPLNLSTGSTKTQGGNMFVFDN